MKITKRQLRKLIREQLDSEFMDYSDESPHQRMMYDMGYHEGKDGLQRDFDFEGDPDYEEGYVAGEAAGRRANLWR